MTEKDYIDIILGDLIRDLRIKKNLSQEKLAELGDFERSYISKVENAERAKQLKTFIRFAKSLDVKPSYLMLILESEIY